MAYDPAVRAKESGYTPRTHSACPFPCHHTLALADVCESCESPAPAEAPTEPGFPWMATMGSRLARFHVPCNTAFDPTAARPLRSKSAQLQGMDLRADAVKWALSHLQQKPVRESVKKDWTFHGIHCDGNFADFGNTADGMALLQPVLECASFVGVPVRRYFARYVNSAKQAPLRVTWLGAVLPDGAHVEAAVAKYDDAHFEAPICSACSCDAARDKPLKEFDAVLAWLEAGSRGRSPAPTPVPCKHVAGIIQHAGPFQSSAKPFSSHGKRRYEDVSVSSND